ncbi:HNH endonuclease [Bifidobacterium margollesii]|uniref:HNH endonuclease n=1 Tax=Bifidobacterium margollesii TaxID=2020964 RepID=A0A2N5JD46_9BIFI|nr:HNH endonuclease [Bifidobacterium margollesii]PLS32109.1 HNH endonuclease [Bifidobacterium margollesii]
MNAIEAERLRRRIDAKTDKQAGGHWIWTAHADSSGHPVISIGNKPRQARRVAYELAHGTVPAGMVVTAICGVPACVNPGHLEAVTRSQADTRRKASSLSTTGVRGVTWRKDRNCYLVAIRINGRRHRKSGFHTIEEAARYIQTMRNQ